jgi:hypothetical protein
VRRVLFTRTKGIGFKKFFTHDIIVEQVAPDHLHEQCHTNLDDPDVAGYLRQTYDRTHVFRVTNTVLYTHLS